ncbi:hypothetical protein BpHYR1_000071 [Brachionus plicatilis]|uniref:Uncharacterized protein n=1 Tax=Brachionus plicatilis TaxID=10195 RepID=A0A3M7SEP7_BRAPC|nr:hypothetical protein BpHYR1_000071 [Brachionus plicatilis]
MIYAGSFHKIKLTLSKANSLGVATGIESSILKTQSNVHIGEFGNFDLVSQESKQLVLQIKMNRE